MNNKWRDFLIDEEPKYEYDPNLSLISEDDFEDLEDYSQILNEAEDLLDEKKGKKRKAAKKKRRKKKKKAKGKKDACYHKVRARYDVWPSAYASGALVKCRKVGAKNWGNKSKKTNEELELDEEILEGIVSETTQMSSQQLEQHYQQHQDFIFNAIEQLEILKKKYNGSTNSMNWLKRYPTREMAAKNPSIDPQYAASVEVLYPDSQRDYVEFNNFLDEFHLMMRGAGYHASRVYDMSIDGLIKSLKKKVDKFLMEKKKRKKKRKLTSKPSSERSLRDWFGRRGAKGGKKGWVDCNAPDGKGGYKSCGRSSGEKRKRYPACRPTPGACKKMKGSKGKSWGKKDSKRRGKKK
mgnify:CR=1 FL=1|tara:strand:+ start:2265 stop:3317 length:1053 start_codon:yes stop_codon:yes gene_type:complete